MISLKLILFLSIIILIYFLIVLRAVRNGKFPIKSSVLWFCFGILMIIFICFPKLLLNIAKLVGIETISNMLLFGGVLALLILSFDLYKQMNQEKRKNIILAQEIGILKNEIKNK